MVGALFGRTEGESVLIQGSGVAGTLSTIRSLSTTNYHLLHTVSPGRAN